MSQKQLLLVDTNIISHALTPNQTQSYIKLFADLEKDYRFAVTGLTKYELMCSSDKEHRAKITEYLEQNMVYIELSNVLMDFSARLCFLYGKHKSTKSQKISMPDIVNGAFSIAKPCSILTIDNNDYPTPFFVEQKRLRISYTSKQKKPVTDTAFILHPDIDNLKECFNNHEV